MYKNKFRKIRILLPSKWTRLKELNSASERKLLFIYERYERSRDTAVEILRKRNWRNAPRRLVAPFSMKLKFPPTGWTWVTTFTSPRSSFTATLRGAAPENVGAHLKGFGAVSRASSARNFCSKWNNALRRKAGRCARPPCALPRALARETQRYNLGVCSNALRFGENRNCGVNGSPGPGLARASITEEKGVRRDERSRGVLAL